MIDLLSCLKYFVANTKKQVRRVIRPRLHIEALEDRIVPIVDPTIGFAASAYAVVESSGNVVVTIERQNTDGIASVSVGATAGSAESPVDFNFVGQTLNFAAGQASLTLNVDIVQDGLIEPDEEFTLTLSNPSSGNSLGVATTIITIKELPFVNFANSEYGISEGGSVTVTVEISKVSADDVTVYYATSNGTAEYGDDYTSVSDSVVISAGQTSATFSVQVLTDTSMEGAENFTISLSNPSGAALGDIATTNLTVYAQFDSPEDVVADLNRLSGDIETRLTGITTLRGQIATIIAAMAGNRAAGQGFSPGAYAASVGTLSIRVSSVLELGRQIIAKGLEAATASEGISFRIEGISADMNRLAAKLDDISALIEGEKSAWTTEFGNYRQNMQRLQTQLEFQNDESQTIYTDEDFWVVPEGAPESTGILNGLYDDMEALLVNVIARHDQMAPIATDLWNAAPDYANDIVSGEEYYLLVSNYGSLASANAFDVAGDGNNGSAVAKANNAKDRTTGDAFALKGIRAVLGRFDLRVFQEGYFAESLIDYLADLSITSGDPVTNLGIIADGLLEVHDAIVAV